MRPDNLCAHMCQFNSAQEIGNPQTVQGRFMPRGSRRKTKPQSNSMRWVLSLYYLKTMKMRAMYSNVPVMIENNDRLLGNCF